jgi:uncharacterized protein YfaS (alpha-2-macroglobulin family)
MSNTGVYTTGNDVLLSAHASQFGVDVDPTTVTCTVTDPAETVTTPTVTHDSTGHYHATVPSVAVVGRWSYRFVGTGSNAAAAEKFFYVKASV